MLGFRAAAEGKNYQGAAVKFPYCEEPENPNFPDLSQLRLRGIPDIG